MPSQPKTHNNKTMCWRFGEKGKRLCCTSKMLQKISAARSLIWFGYDSFNTDYSPLWCISTKTHKTTTKLVRKKWTIEQAMDARASNINLPFVQIALFPKSTQFSQTKLPVSSFSGICEGTSGWSGGEKKERLL